MGRSAGRGNRVDSSPTTSQLQPVNFLVSTVAAVSTPRGGADLSRPPRSPTPPARRAAHHRDATRVSAALFDGGAHFGIDGQVYGIRPSIAELADGTAPATTTNPWNFVSVLLWSAFEPGHDVTWVDLAPIFTQYANLYPVMSRFVDLADYNSVVAYHADAAVRLRPRRARPQRHAGHP